MQWHCLECCLLLSPCAAAFESHASPRTAPPQVSDLQSLLRQSGGGGGAHALSRGLAGGTPPAAGPSMPAFLPHPSQLTQHQPRAAMQALPPYPDGLGLR